MNWRRLFLAMWITARETLCLILALAVVGVLLYFFGWIVFAVCGGIGLVLLWGLAIDSAYDELKRKGK